MLAETYGTTHLGATRALGSAIEVMGAALAPAVFGGLIQIGVALDSVLLGCAGGALAASTLALLATRRHPSTRSDDAPA